MVESVRVSENHTIHASTGKMVESGLVLGKGRIRGSTKKSSIRVPEKGRIPTSIGKMYNPRKYRKKGSGECRKMVESVRVS